MKGQLKKHNRELLFRLSFAGFAAMNLMWISIALYAGADEGKFKEGKRHGKGVYTLPNGARYEGRHEENKRHGRGVLIYPDGRKYEGQFENGEFHGQGVRIGNNGIIGKQFSLIFRVFRGPDLINRKKFHPFLALGAVGSDFRIKFLRRKSARR